MNKEQIETAAKELPLNFRSRYEYVKSLQDHFGLDDEEGSTFLWILEMWDRKHGLPEPTEFKIMSESTVSSAGKEVKTADELLKNYLKDVNDGLPNGTMYTVIYNEDLQKGIVSIMEEYANQFKATPAKVISDEHIRSLSIDYMKSQDGFIHDKQEGFIRGAEMVNEWYREQLKQHP